MTLPIPKPVLTNDWDSRNKNGYDVVIIASGYGGSIPAARLSEKLKGRGTVCVLERGREWPIGTFPDTMRAATESLYHPLLNPLGLFEINASADVSVMHA